MFSFRLFYFKVFCVVYFIRKCFSDKVMSNNSITVDKQAIYSNYGDYGVLYMGGNGALSGNTISINGTFTVSAGSYGSFTEVFVLPDAE